MATHSRAQSLATDKAENWVDLWDGARLPRWIVITGEGDGGDRGDGRTSILAELCAGLSVLRHEETPLKAREESQKAYPRKSAFQWKKEDMPGQRGVGVGMRVGRDDYTSL